MGYSTTPYIPLISLSPTSPTPFLWSQLPNLVSPNFPFSSFSPPSLPPSLTFLSFYVFLCIRTPLHPSQSPFFLPSDSLSIVVIPSLHLSLIRSLNDISLTFSLLFLSPRVFYHLSTLLHRSSLFHPLSYAIDTLCIIFLFSLFSIFLVFLFFHSLSLSYLSFIHSLTPFSLLLSFLFNRHSFYLYSLSFFYLYSLIFSSYLSFIYSTTSLCPFQSSLLFNRHSFPAFPSSPPQTLISLPFLP